MEEFKYTLNNNSTKTFTSLRPHNIVKRFNLWQENIKTGEVQSSHLDTSVDTLERAIDVAQGFQEFSDRIEKGRYKYHVDIEILVEDSDGNSLMEGGDIAYAITVYPEVNDFLK